MTEAWKTDLPTSRKIVLLALCDNANDQGECYPSIPMIAGKCSLNERVVYKCLLDLETGGYLKRDTRSGRSTIYRISNPCIWSTPAFNTPLNHVQVTPAPGAPPPLNHVQVTPAPGAPITISEPSIEPSINHKGDGSKKSGRESDHTSAGALPDWLPAASWDALIEHRKATKSAMTQQAKKLAISKLDELREQGNDPASVINQTILNGWKGLFPILDNQRQPQQAKRRNIHDERAETIASLTGRNRQPEATGRIIDITPTAAYGVD